MFPSGKLKKRRLRLEKCDIGENNVSIGKTLFSPMGHFSKQNRHYIMNYELKIDAIADFNAHIGDRNVST